MNKKVLLIPIIIILFCFDILALSYVNGEKIKNDAKNWLKTFNVEENLSILPEIKYPVCDKIEFTNISMNYSLIKAQCFSPNEWSLILRNKLKKENNSFNVKKSIEKKSKKPHYPEIEIFVLKQQLEKGVKISDLDITTKKVKRNFKSDGLITSREELVGRKTKVRIRRDQPIYNKYLKKNWLIEKDSKVIVENNSGPITIKVDGIALENGDYKDRIKVKNLRSDQVIYGFVLNKKKILINPKQN